MADPFDIDGPAGFGFEEARDEPRRWLSRVLTSVAVVAAIGGFAGVLYYAYNKGKEVGVAAVPPIIRAGPAPHKIRPEQPGGMAIPNRDKRVYDRLATRIPAPTFERLLPPPEKPVPSPAAKPKPAPKTARIALPPQPPVATVPKRPPNEVAMIKPARAPAPPSKPRRVASATAAIGIATDARPASPASPAKAVKAAAKLAAIAPASGAPTGRFRVQIAALRSEAAVRRSWGKLKIRHPDLLGTIPLIVERRNLGAGKGVFFRMQVGPLATREAAAKLCSSLKRRKLGCIVVRR